MENEEKGFFNYNYHRAYVYNPLKRRNEFKSFNTQKHSKEEIEQMVKQWKADKKNEFDEEKRKMHEKEKIKVSPFNLELDDKYGLSILLIGSTRSGKTTCLNYMMDNYFFKKENKYINVMFSYSYHADTYDNFKKNKNTCGSIIYDPSIVQDLYKINRQTNNKYKFNVILDDVVDQKHDTELKKMLTIYRNSRIGTILCLQNDKLMNATTRSNINHVLLFKMNSDESIEKLIKTYLLSYFPRHYKMIDRIKKYRELTNDHHFFWINNLTGSMKLCKIQI